MDPLSALSVLSSAVALSISVQRKIVGLRGSGYKAEESLEREVLALSKSLSELQIALLGHLEFGTATPDLEDALNKCTEKVRDLESQCSDQAARTPWRRLGWAKPSFGKAKVEIKECRKDIEMWTKKISTHSDLDSGSLDASLPNAASIHPKVSWDRGREVMQWLSPFDHGDRHRALQRMRVSGMEVGIYKSNEFRFWLNQGPNSQVVDEQKYLKTSDRESWVDLDAAWDDRDSSPKLLWLVGKPGSGKTVLTSYIIDHLRTSLSTEDGVGVAFCYFDYRFQQDLSHVVGSLLRQICLWKPQIPEMIQRLFNSVADDESENDEQRPPLGDFIRALQSICLEFRKMYIVIDAIDEHDSFGNMEMMQLLEGLRACSCKVLLTSRPYTDQLLKIRRNPDQIRTVFASSKISLSISPERQDILTYITTQLERSQALETMNSEKIMITARILSASLEKNEVEAPGYNFLLAKMKLDWLLEQLADHITIDDALSKMPVDMPVLFNGAIDRNTNFINSDSNENHQLAESVLFWLLHAKRPLSVRELCHACAVRETRRNGDRRAIPEYEMLEKACNGLISVDDSTSTVSLVHYSVYEFFRDHKPQLFPQGRREIALLCLEYLKSDVFGSIRQDEADSLIELRNHPLLGYVMHTWYLHCRERENDDDKYFAELEVKKRKKYSEEKKTLVGETVKLSLELLSGSWHNIAALFSLEEVARHHRAVVLKAGLQSIGLPPCHLAAKFGLLREASYLLQKEPSSAFSLSVLHSIPLHHAAYEGHVNVAEELLKWGGPESIVAFDDDDFSAIHYAAYRGSTDLIRLFLRNTKSQDVIDLRGRKTGMTPLMVAASTGRLGVMKFLIRHGADIMLRNESGKSALHLAASWGSEPVVKYLLRSGADIFLRDRYGWTSLHYATERSKYAVVELLLAWGSNVNALSYKGAQTEGDETPLSLAVRNKNVDMMELLLLRGADTHIAKVDGKDLISYADEKDLREARPLLLHYSRVT